MLYGIRHLKIVRTRPSRINRTPKKAVEPAVLLFGELRHSFLSALGPSLLHEFR
jgi:hypothetical protein